MKIFNWLLEVIQSALLVVVIGPFVIVGYVAYRVYTLVGTGWAIGWAVAEVLKR